MGYRRSPKIYTLVFDDPELDDLEVRARGIDIDGFFEFMDLYEAVQGAGGPKAMRSAQAMRDMFARFESVLVGWNLENPVLDDSGNETGEWVAVPATAEGLRSQDPVFGFTIVGAWIGAVKGAATPLDPGSNGGGPELSLPMEPLSPNPPS